MNTRTRRLPALGAPHSDITTCQHSMAGRLCGMSATHHIMWDETGENSLACSTDADVALGRYDVVGVHERGPVCGLPGAVWFPEDCLHPLDLEFQEIIDHAELVAV